MERKGRFITFFSLFLALFLLVPGRAADVSAANNGKVRVVIENNVYTKAQGAPWDGRLVDEDVRLWVEDTMMDVIVRALEARGYTQTGAESGYILSIHGLHGEGAGDATGWVGKLNDCFAGAAFNEVSVKDGDEVHVLLSKTYGRDEGLLNDNTDTKLKSLSFGVGELTPAFSADEKSYVLDLPQGTESITVQAEAVNKKYQVNVYKGAQKEEDRCPYREEIPVRAGDLLTVACEKPAWMGADDEAQPSIYTVKISIAGSSNAVPRPTKADEVAGVDIGSAYTVDLGACFEDGDGDALTYQVSVDGGDLEAAAQAYSYTPETEGTHILRFKASDGKAESKEYVVTLYVDEGQKYSIYLAEGAEGGQILTFCDGFGNNGGVFPHEGLGKTYEVKISVAPDKGKALESISVDTKTGRKLELSYDGTYYSFIMPSEDVTIHAKFQKGCTVTVAGTARSGVFGTYMKAFDADGNEVLGKSKVSNTIQRASGHQFYVTKAGIYKYFIYKEREAAQQDREDYLKEGEVAVTEEDIEKGRKDILYLCWEVENRISDGYLQGVDATCSIDGVGTFPCSERASKPAAGGGYNRAVFYMDITGSLGEDLKLKNDLTVRYTAKPVDKNLAEGQYEDTLKKSTKNFQLTTPHTVFISNLDLKTRIKLPKGSNPGLYQHPGYAYKKLPQIDNFHKVDEDEKYEVWEGICPRGQSMHIIAGGDGTPYKKYDFMFMGPDKSGERTFDLALKDDPPVADSFVASDDLYTNAPDGNYFTMTQGEEKSLEGFRVTQTVTNSIGNMFVEPDMHYEVIAGDSVTLTDEGAVGRKYQKIHAVKEGVSVIEVTYDDICIWEVGSTYSDPDFNVPFKYCNPIDEKNRGIVIVNVGGDRGDITCRNMPREFDTYYYARTMTLPDGSQGKSEDHAEYTFSAASSKELSVDVHEPLYLNSDWGSGWTPAVKNGDDYTVSLKDGRNIVRIKEKDGSGILYYTIMGKAVDVSIENRDRPGDTLKVGDTANVNFKGLELPIYKMCGIYNPGWPDTTWVEYEVDGVEENPRSSGVQYAIHVLNTVPVKITKEGETVMENGRIHSTHMGDTGGSHRNISPDGAKPNLSAEERVDSPYFGQLPRITLTASTRGPETDVIDLINKIDTKDYLGCIRAIMTARTAYDEFIAEYPGYQAKVTNYDKLTTAEGTPSVGRTIQVVQRIDELPSSASLAYEGAIMEAEQAYDGLASDAERAGADKATGSKLVGLIDALDRLIAEEARRQRIEAVDAVIGALPDEGSLTGDDSVIAAINDAKRAYDALGADEQAEVAGTARLTALVQLLPDLNAANNVIRAIAQIGEVTQETYQEKEAIVGQAASLYQNLTERQRGYVSNKDVLEKARYDVDYYGAEQALRPVMEKLAALQEALTQIQASGKPAGEAWTQWRAQVQEAQAAYDALTDSQKESLKDYAGVLQAARAYTLQAGADEVAALIGALPDPGTVGAYDPAQAQGQLTEDQLRAIAAAQEALQALAQEAVDLLPQGAQEKLAALVEEAGTYPPYAGIVLQPFIEGFTQAYQTYQETGVTRKDMEAVNALLARYDGHTPEEQAILDQTLAQMRGWLQGEAQRIEGEIQATDDLDSRIQALPNTVDIQAWQGLLGEIQEIEAAYGALSEDAKSYVTDIARLDSLKAQIQVFQAQVAQFQAGTPALTATADTPTQVTLTWEAYADATSYRIYRKGGSGGWEELAQTGALSYTDRTVRGCTAYTYTIQALSTKWGQTVEGARDEAGETVTTPFGSVPELKGARAVRYDRIALTWTRCADATGYEVYRAEAARGTYKKVKTLKGSQTLTWTDTRLRTGRTYYYKIRAYRTMDGRTQRAGYSNMRSARPVLSAAAIRKASVKGRKATVGWKKVNGASGYVIYRSNRKDRGYKAIKTVKRAAAGQYTDKKLKRGKTYYYKMRAYRTVDGKRVYGGYSRVKAARVR